MFKAMGRGWVIGVSHFEGDERCGGGVRHVKGDGKGWGEGR